jgi:hypothetical protein
VQTRLSEEFSELLLRAFAAFREDHHEHVHHLTRMRSITRRNDGVDDQEPGAIVHRRAAATQDAHALLVTPVV